MRVILDGVFRGSGGVSRHMLDLATGLQAAGVDVLLELPDGAEDARAAAEARGLPLRIRRDAKSVDIVHIHLADTYDRAAFSRLLSYGRSAPIIVTEHLPHSNASDRLLRWGGSRRAEMAKTIFKRTEFALVDRTVLLSHSCRTFFARRYGVSSSRLRLIPNGIPEPVRAVRESWGGQRVVAAGSLSVQKGFDVLVRAAAQASGWSVEIFGEGHQRARLGQLAHELNAPVRFCGWRGPEQISMETAAVVCIPSRWEALPYVALEAMWASAPVIASCVDGLTDLVVDDHTGLLTESDDPVALAQAISAVVSDPRRAERLGRAGRARAAMSFSYEAMIDGVLGVYEEVRRTQPLR